MTGLAAAKRRDSGRYVKRRMALEMTRPYKIYVTTTMKYS